MIRNFVIEEAKREGQKARIALTGVSGSGKTYTALLTAKVLTDNGKVLVIDTENKSSSLYADEFPGWTYSVINWTPPFDPRELTELIRAEQNNFDAIIIDSLSAYWNDKGGILEIVDNQTKGNNKASGWLVGTPIQNTMIQSILRANCHMILCMRAKQGVEMEKDERGRTQVRRLGLQAIQKDTVIYEMTISGMIDVSDHSLKIEKTRYSAIADKVFRLGETVDFATQVKNWLDSAEAEKATATMEREVQEALDLAQQKADEATPSLVSADEAAAIVALFDKMSDMDAVKAAKKQFADKYGNPKNLPASKLEEAQAYAVELVS
jgi:tRNA uridine 5-carbamoylmethylation protein Kti12